MKITFTGTGTSQGIPVIGCSCEVCLSSDTRDKRLRTAILIEDQSHSIAVDAGPDFRQQMLRINQKKLDAILLTHEHNDHLIGLDDVRPFNFKQRSNMPIYGMKRVLTDVQTRFPYIFNNNPYPGIPRLELIEIQANRLFKIGPIEIEPLEVWHGELPIVGYRINNFCYITDAKRIEPAVIEKIKGIDYLVLNALHHKPHYSHFNLKEAIDMVEAINPKNAYFTHMSHNMGLSSVIQKQLPSNITFAYDGLILDI